METNMKRLKRLTEERISAALTIAIGIVAVGIGVSYHMGSLLQMGAGFLPVVFGALLIAVGFSIAITARDTDSTEGDPADHSNGAPMSLRGWVCILGGILAFVIFGRFGGLVPAAFSSVFIASLGDRSSSLAGSATLAAVLTAFSVLVFHYGLSLQLPLWQWN
jgi:hypothetical protein